MRPNIHPEYREVLFHDTNANAYFVIGSTLTTNQTREYEGKTYPYVSSRHFECISPVLYW